MISVVFAVKNSLFTVGSWIKTQCAGLEISFAVTVECFGSGKKSYVPVQSMKISAEISLSPDLEAITTPSISLSAVMTSTTGCP